MRALLIPHGQQLINQSINCTLGLVNVLKAIFPKQDSNRKGYKLKAEIDICGPFFKNSDFSGVFGVT